MTNFPPENIYHRSMGWHAPALRRAVIFTAFGLIVALVLAWFVAWELATVLGWDAAALAFLLTTWPIIRRADSTHTELLATREDETRGPAAVLLVAAGTVSLPGVAFVLGLAGRQSGSSRLLLVAVAMVTVLLSWTVINTVFTVRYAHLNFRTAGGGIGFDDPPGKQQRTYRDFAYVAFTIGMTYQVSDTTIRDLDIRRSVLFHAVLSYVFGAVIVAGFVNLIGGLIS